MGGACSAFTAWPTVCRSADAQQGTGAQLSSAKMHGATHQPCASMYLWSGASTVEAVVHPNNRTRAMGSWLSFANGLPSCGELAHQLHTAAPEACAELADLLQAVA